MSDRQFCLFDTVLGRCGVAWSARGVTRVALPEASDEALRARLALAVDGTAPPFGGAAGRGQASTVEAPASPTIAGVIAQITDHVRGAPGALETIVLDMTGVPAFYREVYDAARTIPSGQTVSYGALAIRLGKPGGARAIGQAMGKNPFPIVVPCHRVLAARHATGGFSAHGGVATKARLLAAEGFTLALQPDLPFSR